jgi:hypothetical protein
MGGSGVSISEKAAALTVDDDGDGASEASDDDDRRPEDRRSNSIASLTRSYSEFAISAEVATETTGVPPPSSSWYTRRRHLASS